MASLIKRNRLSVTVTIFLAKTLAGCSDQSPSAHRFRSASVQGTVKSGSSCAQIGKPLAGLNWVNDWFRFRSLLC